MSTTKPAAAGPFTYSGLFFVALSTLMYEILLTRIFSVTMMYHFAFVAISVAMFGMTVGALLVYLRPDRFPSDRPAEQLARWGTAFPILIAFSFLTELSIPFRVHPSIVAIYGIALTYVVVAIPFVASGVCVCIALTRYPSSVSRLYGIDLVGAALGCVALVYVLRLTDGPTAVFVVAFLAAIGGWCFAKAAGWRGGLALASCIALGLFAFGHTLLVWRQFPVLRILYIRGSFEARPLYEKWNSYSRVRVNGVPQALVTPSGWGLSERVPQDLKVHQLQMDLDVSAGTVITGYSGKPAEIEHLKYDVTNIGYYIRPDARALVVGAGGGRDVLSALAFGARSVTAVEINSDVLRTVNRRFGDFSGHLDRDPRIHFVNDEARSYIARSTDRVDFLQISLIDTWAATAAGAFVLSENSLYTREAWHVFLNHLSDDGILSASRWYFRAGPGEMLRLAALASASLRDFGVADPRRHLIIVRNMNLANKPDAPDGVGTLLVGRRPFTDDEITKIEEVSKRLGFEVVLSSRTALDDSFVQVTSADGFAPLVRNYPVNISPPTDNSPFFFNQLRFRNVFDLQLLDFGKQTHNMRAVFVLAVLLATVTILTALCIVLPLMLTADRAALTGKVPLLVFFIAIGLGFMLIETSQMQRLIISLGHPTYGLTVVLFALLLSSGVGSYLTSGISEDRAGRAGIVRLTVLLAVLVVFGVITPSIARWTESATTPVRVVAAVALLFPPGLAMGMAFPLGMKLASNRAAELTPWLWGLNGAASVLASVLTVCIGLTWSISAAFWCGALCYLIALAAFSRARAVY